MVSYRRSAFSLALMLSVKQYHFLYKLTICLCQIQKVSIRIKYLRQKTISTSELGKLGSYLGQKLRYVMKSFLTQCLFHFLFFTPRGPKARNCVQFVLFSSSLGDCFPQTSDVFCEYVTPISFSLSPFPFGIWSARHPLLLLASHWLLPRQNVPFENQKKIYIFPGRCRCPSGRCLPYSAAGH